MSNEDLVEELMWTAYEQNKGIELAELAADKIKYERLSRVEAYEKAFTELGLKHKDETH